MLWLIFIIWVIFVMFCGILAELTGKEVFSFLFLASIPIIFYVPMFLK